MSYHRTTRSPLPSFASLRSCLTCSKQPGVPEIPPFCTDVSMYSFFKRNFDSCRDKMLKNILPSVLSSEMVLNWSMSLEFSSLGIQTPSAHLHWSATLPLHQITLRIFHSCWSLGQRLYTLYGTPLGPGAEADLAALTTSWTSLQLGSLMSNSVAGELGLSGLCCGRVPALLLDHSRCCEGRC